MTTSRRTFVKGSVATAAAISAPGLLKAQSAPTKARTVRAVLHGDLKIFDPIWTTANMTGNHGLLIYDTLFGLDDKRNVQPQMVDKWGVSDDKKTYTFTLRDGLKFHDGQAVTSADVVASIRRWSARDGAAQHMFKRVADTPIKDDKTFQIVLKEPYGLVLEALGKIETNLPVIMRKKDAETDPNQQVTTKVGSGPFTFNEDETKSGQRYVYDKNPSYVPRNEPPSGMVGGKVAKVDRVIIENMADEQTAVAALKAGEIDFYEVPPIDLLDQLESDKNIKLDVLNKGGNVGMCRLNWLHPPFDKVEARQAMLHLIKQEDILKAVFGNPKYYRSCGSLFACTGLMQSDVNTDWFKGGQNIAKARGAVQEGRLRRPPGRHPAGDQYLLHEQRVAARCPVAEGGRRQRRAGSVRLGRGRHPARGQEAGRRGRLEHLHHLGLGRRLRQSDRVRRPYRQWRSRLVRLAQERSAREAARRMGARRHARRAQGGRAQAAGERLELRADGAARPMGAAGRPPCQRQRLYSDPGPRAVLERREDVRSSARRLAQPRIP